LQLTGLQDNDQIDQTTSGRDQGDDRKQIDIIHKQVETKEAILGDAVLGSDAISQTDFS